MVFLNDVLQGKGGRAMTTLTRFLINSTVGLLGLVDVATKAGIEGYDEEFGQTLAVWVAAGVAREVVPQSLFKGLYLIRWGWSASSPRRRRRSAS